LQPFYALGDGFEPAFANRAAGALWTAADVAIVYS
jgi:hypothetical protein